jgi:hypothetical protein
MTIKVHMNDGMIEEYPNAHIYWEWDESEKGTDSGYRINSMDRNFNSAVAFAYPGECAKIEITPEESDRVFKSPPREDCMPVKRYKIFRTIHEERIRQDEKWGEQNHPMLDIPFTAEGMGEKEYVYKRINDIRENPSWFAVLMEEVYEAFAETDPVKQREEIVQVAAVAVQIIECLDRRIEGGANGG